VCGTFRLREMQLKNDAVTCRGGTEKRGVRPGAGRRSECRRAASEHACRRQESPFDATHNLIVVKRVARLKPKRHGALTMQMQKSPAT
jgi:hypothetical protein